MNRQGWIDLVAARMRAQGEPALSLNGGCSYRTPGGYRCAVGIVLSDSAIDVIEDCHIEGEAIVELLGYGGAPLSDTVAELLAAEIAVEGLPHNHLAIFWDSIQKCHDDAAIQRTSAGRQFHTGAAFVERFNVKLQALCTRLDLDYPA